MSDIIVAPFSNSDIRDWPVTHYAALIGHLLPKVGAAHLIRVVGTPNQRLRANEIVRRHPADRVVNECGRMSWPTLVTDLRAAACLIGNNSGLAHLSGSFGIPTVCVFGGSHQRAEWRPLGPAVVVVSRAIGCSPCYLDHGRSSPYGKACLRQIAPRTVADAAFMIMERGRLPAPRDGQMEDA